MAVNKSKKKKDILSRAVRMNRRIPIFVVARTNRRVSRNLSTRHWRGTKMKIKEK